jgi:hypothetical protein
VRPNPQGWLSDAAAAESSQIAQDLEVMTGNRVDIVPFGRERSPAWSFLTHEGFSSPLRGTSKILCWR